jgi:hypothetical protein
MKIRQTILSAFIGIPVAALYALLVRLTFGRDEFSVILGTMTCSFLLLVPLAIGALTVVLAPPEYKKLPHYYMFMPWISILIVTVGSAFLVLEAAICIFMASPIFLILSSIGGYLFRGKENEEKKSTQNTMLGIIILAPYLFTPIEMQFPIKETIKTVENQITINATAETVWNSITEIPAIDINEQGFSIFHSFGVPQLTEATPLSYLGVGGSRDAVFNNGLVFTESVTFWDENNQIVFSISQSNNSSAFAPYSMIGKEYFSVTEMAYWIEPINDNTVILHLKSTHKLNTRFNSYAALWTQWMLSDLQDYVLAMIKNRVKH